MRMNVKTDKKDGYKRPSLAAGMAVFAAAFFIVLAGLKFYQYVKVKNLFISNELNRISSSEVEKLRALVGNISTKLYMLHDLAASGVFNFSDIVSLNRQLMPLLKNQEILTGIIVADNTGREYFIHIENGKWITRLSSPREGGSKMVFQEWVSPERSVKKWERASDYDPRSRPWFKRMKPERRISWTPVYNFFSSGKPGVTASISCKKPGSGTDYFVIAMDLPVERLQHILAGLNRENNIGEFFMVNPESRFFVTASEMGIMEGKSAHTAGEGRGVQEHELMSGVILAWTRSGMPTGRLVKAVFNNRKWMASYMPLAGQAGDYWLGITAPEEAVMADIRSSFYKIDVFDLVISLGGGTLLFLVFWWGRPRLAAGAPETRGAPERLRDYISRGEDASVEFKSTVRTNLKTGKQGKEIEFAWLKAVVAFLNSRGGALIIGVDDSGEIVGIGPDNFENDDRCQLHLKNLINHHIGAEFSGFINIELVKVDGKTVVLLECSPSKEPVFMRIGKNEEFYIRSGPSSMKLSPSQMISYVLQKMRKK